MILPSQWLAERAIVGALSLVLLGVAARAETLLPPDPAVTTGQVIPFGGFVDEADRPFPSLLSTDDVTEAKRPWVVSPIYTRCTFTCLPITANLRAALAQSGLQPSEYRVVSFSFDPSETAETLRRFRAAADLPSEWLTLRATSPEALEHTLRALDFRTIRIGDGQFEHPNLLVVLTPERRLAQYLFGVTFSPTRLAGAVRSAERGVSPVAGWEPYMFVLATGGFVASTILFFTLLSKRRSQRPRVV